MNEEQLRLFIRQAFALSAREAEMLARSDSALLRAMSEIRLLVEQNLPDDGLLREQAWRQIRSRAEAELGSLNDSFARSVYEGLTDELPEMAEEASAMVRAAGVPLPPATGLPVAQSTETILHTKVGNRRLAGLFERGGASSLSPFIKSASDAINRRVVEGILRGTPTKDIADMLAVTYIRNAQEYISLGGPTAAREIRAGMRAIARTAIQDANRQVHEEIYKANEDRLGGLEWEWVAALDSRTCPTCAPLDGKRWKNRKSAPVWPVHPNCRCQVVAVDPDEAADVRSGQMVSQDKLSGDRAYKTKVMVKGEKLHRKAVDVKPGKDGKAPSYADYLAQMGPKKGTAASETQQMFFGGGNAGNARAVRFNALVQSGVTPEKALRLLVTGDPAQRGFVPVDKLPAVPERKPPSKPKSPATPPPKPKPVTPPPAPAPSPAVQGLTMTSPKAAKWVAKNGDPGELIDEAFAVMEAEGGLAGKHAQQLRQFARQNKVMGHFPMIGERDASSFHYADQIEDMIDSQRGLVERMRKYKPVDSDDAFTHKLRLRASEGVLKDLEERKGPGLKRGLQTTIENISAGGYTRPTTAVVNVNLSPDSGRPGAKGIAELQRRAKENLEATVEAVKKNLPEAMPFSGFSGTSEEAHWLGVYTHEMGHQVHYQGLNGRAYLGKKKDGLEFVSDYGSTDPDEQFAEAYVQYVFNPEGLKKHAPGLYGYVEKAITNALQP